MSASYDKSELESDSVRITTATTTTIGSTTKKILIKRIIVGTTAAGAITLRNGAGTTKLVLKASIAEGNYDVGLVMLGADVVTGGASDITVIYHLLA